MRKTDNHIDSINLVEEFRPQSLAETAGNNYFLYSAAALAIDGMSYGFKGFGPGRGNKTACVNDDNIRIIRLSGYRKSRLSDFSQHSLAVNHILWAA